MKNSLLQLPSFHASDRVGVAIARTRSGHHLAVVYACEEGSFLLHQAFHYAFRRDALIGQPYRWIKLPFPEERLKLVARLCVILWRRFRDGGTDRLPYAFKYAGGVFTQMGQFVSKGGQGLTCATFVLAVFASQGLKLLNEDQWPERPDEDRKMFDQIIEWLRNRDPVHAAAVEQERGCVRFRPEEVAAAGMHKSPPADFGFASSVSLDVINELKSEPPL